MAAAAITAADQHRQPPGLLAHPPPSWAVVGSGSTQARSAEQTRPAGQSAFDSQASLQARAAPQLPLTPETLAKAVHALQDPSQAASQQTPLTQKVDSHSEPSSQGSPSARPGNNTSALRSGADWKPSPPATSVRPSLSAMARC